MSWNKSSDYNNMHGATIKIRKLLPTLIFKPFITFSNTITFPSHSTLCNKPT